MALQRLKYVVTDKACKLGYCATLHFTVVYGGGSAVPKLMARLDDAVDILIGTFSRPVDPAAMSTPLAISSTKSISTLLSHLCSFHFRMDRL